MGGIACWDWFSLTKNDARKEEFADGMIWKEWGNNILKYRILLLSWQKKKYKMKKKESKEKTNNPSPLLEIQLLCTN